MLKISPTENVASVTVTENVPAGISPSSELSGFMASPVVFTSTVMSPETANPSSPTREKFPLARILYPDDSPLR